MSDVDFCPNCGENIPDYDREFRADLVLDRYRTEFRCASCGYHGEVFRHNTDDEWATVAEGGDSSAE